MELTSFGFNDAARVAASGGADARPAQVRVAQTAAETLIAVAAGALLGWLSWSESRTPAAAAHLPVFVSLCGSRRLAFAFAAAYTAALLRYTATFIAAWFGDNVLIGAAAVSAYACCTAVAWSLAWSASPKPWRKALAIFIAWCAALLPPIGIAAPGHPVIAWGSILPGSGWMGVCASAAVPAALVAGVQISRVPRLLASGTLLCVAIALSVCIGTPHAAVQIAGLHAMQTHWGKLHGYDDALTRIAAGGQASASRTEQVIAWPESAIGIYDPAYDPVLRIEVLNAARKSGAVHVIGMDAPDGVRFRNVAAAFYPNGKTAFAVARQPAVVSLWHPWSPSGSFIADYGANNVLVLPAGGRVAVIFCYEEYLPFLYMLNELRDRPTAYLAMSNTWAARYREADAIQRRHSEGMAMLFGRPYARAVNRASSEL
jgi:hypothetical protein